MDSLRTHFRKAILLLVLLCAPGNTSRNRFQSRQTSICANQVMGAFVPNPHDCHLFYLCGENGEAVIASCPPNMMFNSQIKLCDTKANTKCEQIIQIPLATPMPSASTSPFFNIQQFCLDAYEQKLNSDSLIFLAHPSKCNLYYMCYYGKALLQECSRDLQWNARSGKCDFPSNAKCQPEGSMLSIPFATTELSPAGGNGIVCPIYGQHIFPHMERCNMFIYCVKGYAILQQCPFYKDFDVERSRCMWRKSALCIKDLKLEFRKNTF